MSLWSLGDGVWLSSSYTGVDLELRSLGGGVDVLRLLLLRRLLLGECLLETCSFAGVMLPVEKLLLVDELGALSVHQLLPEVLVLQQLQHVQAVRVLEKLCILGLLPVQQILQVVDVGSLSQEASLGQKVKVVWVC